MSAVPTSIAASPAQGLAALRPAAAILMGAAVVLSLAMGLRQSLGLFMPPITREIGLSVSDFTFAIAIQNLAWGLLQPVVGAWSVRLGLRRVMLMGGALYASALVVLAMAQGSWAVMLGAGLMVGAALACTGSAITLSVATRAVPVAARSLVLGVVSAAGSLGAMVAAPTGALLAEGWGWRAGVFGFAALALCMLPAGWVAGRIDAQGVPPAPADPVRPRSGEGHANGLAAGLPGGLASGLAGGIPGALAAGCAPTGPARGDSARDAVRSALTSMPFVVMSLAYFVCGMQLVFLTTHLPSYLAICGMDPMLSAQALGVIGGFNVLGSLFFGWAGGRWNRMMLLGGIYSVRSLVLAAYFVVPPTPTSTLVFAAVMGFLWLGVAPLVAGAVADMFGLRWQPMIQGLAFFSHQMGSFAGAYGGGVLYDRLGSYEMAWRVGVAVGLVAGLVQIAVALWRPAGRQPLQATA